MDPIKNHIALTTLGPDNFKERFIAAAEKLVKPEQVVIWVDELHDLGFNLDNLDPSAVVVIDSMTELLEWKHESNQPMPTGQREVIINGRQLGKALVDDMMRDSISRLAEMVEATHFPEKPYLAMNDWRNNRGGRKNR